MYLESLKNSVSLILYLIIQLLMGSVEKNKKFNEFFLKFMSAIVQFIFNNHHKISNLKDTISSHFCYKLPKTFTYNAFSKRV